jgi:hypothetical protein
VGSIRGRITACGRSGAGCRTVLFGVDIVIPFAFNRISLTHIAYWLRIVFDLLNVK